MVQTKMNKRIMKKHMWLGEKRAGLPYCSNQIGQHVHKLLDEAGIKPIRRNIMRYLHWFCKHSTEAEWMKRVDRAHVSDQMMLSAKHLLPRPTYDQMVLYSRGKITIKEWYNRLKQAIDSVIVDTNKVEPPIDIMGIRQTLEKCLQNIPAEDTDVRDPIESLRAGLASYSKSVDSSVILKEYVPVITPEELEEWGRILKVNEPRVFTPYLINPDDDIHIEPEFVDGDLISFSLCRNENKSQEEADE